MHDILAVASIPGKSRCRGRTSSGGASAAGRSTWSVSNGSVFSEQHTRMKAGSRDPAGFASDLGMIALTRRYIPLRLQYSSAGRLYEKDNSLRAVLAPYCPSRRRSHMGGQPGL